MFVHYKLKSTVKYETVAFDGPPEHRESRRHQNRDRSVSYREEKRPTRSPFFRRSPPPEKYRKPSDDYLRSSRRSSKKGRDIAIPGNCYGEESISYREDERPAWSPTFRRCPRRSPPPEKYRKHADDYLQSFRRSPKKKRDIVNPGNCYRDESISYREHERPEWTPTFRRSPPIEKYRNHSDDYLRSSRRSPKKGRGIAIPGNCYGEESISYREDERPNWSPTFRRCPRRSPPPEKYRKHADDYLQSFRRSPKKERDIVNPGNCYRDESISYREHERPARTPTFRRSPPIEKYRKHSDDYLRSFRRSPKKGRGIANPGNCYGDKSISYREEKRPTWSPTFRRSPPLEKYRTDDSLRSFRRSLNPEICYEDGKVPQRKDKRPAWSPTSRKCPRRSTSPEKYREHAGGYLRSSGPSPKKEMDNFPNSGNCYETDRISYGGHKRPARSPTFGRCPISPPPGKFCERPDGYPQSSRPTPRKERNISYPGTCYGDESMFSRQGYLRSPSPKKSPPPKEVRTCDGNTPQTSGTFSTKENDYSKDTHQGRDINMSYEKQRNRSPESLKSFSPADKDCEREDNFPHCLKPPPKEGNELSSQTHHSRDRMGRERY